MTSRCCEPATSRAGRCSGVRAARRSGTDVATRARVADKDSGDRINVAGRVNVARSVNIGSPGSTRSASTKQKVRIVQRDGETVVNEISEEKEASS